MNTITMPTKKTEIIGMAFDVHGATCSIRQANAVMDYFRGKSTLVKDMAPIASSELSSKKKDYQAGKGRVAVPADLKRTLLTLPTTQPATFANTRPPQQHDMTVSKIVNGASSFTVQELSEHVERVKAAGGMERAEKVAQAFLSETEMNRFTAAQEVLNEFIEKTRDLETADK